MSVNWTAKITIVIEMSSPPATGEPLFAPTAGSGIFSLRTTQTYDPVMESNPEPTHSITRERIGYLFRPTRYTIQIGVLASRVLDATLPYADAEVLALLQLGRHEFKITVSGNNNQFRPWEWYRCRVQTSNPSNLTVDGLPVSTWTLTSLKVLPPGRAEAI